MAPRRKVSVSILPSSNKINVTNKLSSKPAKNIKSKRCSNGNHNIDYTNLQLSDVLCPLCRNVLIEPVTLPCQHCFCWRCLQGRLVQQKASGGIETCPQCQLRFGGWYRTAKKQQKLLTNQPLWNAIRKVFLKADNPLHPFLSNGLRNRALASIKQGPTTSTDIKAEIGVLVTTTITPPALLLTVGSDSSNDSTWAMRRDCNHFRPIDGLKHHQTIQHHLKLGQQVPNIVRVPASHGNKSVKLVRPSGKNLFFSDPRLSAFRLVRSFSQIKSVDGQTQIPVMKLQIEKEIIQTVGELNVNTREDKKSGHRNSPQFTYRNNITSEINNQMKSQCNIDINVATNTTTVIMLQTPNQSSQFSQASRENKLMKEADPAVSAKKSKNTRIIMNNNKLKNSIRQKGEQPRRQSARIVAAAAVFADINTHQDNKLAAVRVHKDFGTVISTYNNHDNKNRIDNFVVVEKQLKNKQVQLQVDRQLARQLHRLLNGGATRSNAINIDLPKQVTKNEHIQYVNGDFKS